MNLLKPKYEIGGRKYVVTKQIGEGAYAFVYRVKPFGFGDHPMCALKKLICQTDEQLEEAQKEIKLLSEIHHPNVLHLLASETKPNKKGQTEALLLMPLFERTVQDLIDAGPGYPGSCFRSDPRRCLRICVEFCNGLHAIHAFGFRHCDFKPANVLLRPGASGDDEVVLTDLGSACPLTVQVSSRSEALAQQELAAAVCTASYRPPELLDTPSQCTINGKADVWAAGCTIFNMLFSRTPFENPVEGFSLLAACGGNYRCPNDEPFATSANQGRGVGLSAVAVAQACLLTAPTARPELQQVLGMLECCLSMSPSAVEADPACLVFANVEEKQAASAVQLSKAAAPPEPAPARERGLSDDSMDEFGDFESAAAHPSQDADNASSLPEVAPPVSADVVGSTEIDRDSMVSISGADGVPVSSPGGRVIFEGPIHVMRPKGAISHKMINKTVWGILTDRGIIVRKTVDPSSKVHAALQFGATDDTSASSPGLITSSNVTVKKGRPLSEGSVAVKGEALGGLGPFLLSVHLASLPVHLRSTSSDNGITVQRAFSDTSAANVSGNVASPQQGTKRRKSIFSFSSSAGSTDDNDGTQVPRRRSGPRMFTSHSSTPPQHSGNVDMLVFGVDSADILDEWFNAIVEITGSKENLLSRDDGACPGEHSNQKS